MQFLVIAHDHPDRLDKRNALQGEHLSHRRFCIGSRGLLDGGIVMKDDKPAGSAIIFDLPDRETLDTILANDPYMAGGVWERVEVYDLLVPSPAS